MTKKNTPQLKEPRGTISNFNNTKQSRHPQAILDMVTERNAQKSSCDAGRRITDGFGRKLPALLTPGYGQVCEKLPYEVALANYCEYLSWITAPCRTIIIDGQIERLAAYESGDSMPRDLSGRPYEPLEGRQK